MKRRGNKLAKIMGVCVSMTLALAVAFAINTSSSANASPSETQATVYEETGSGGIFSFFKRVSVKKCAIVLSETSFEWTGEECKPVPTVNYKGTELQYGVDYIVKNKNNIDAGQGTVEVKGKGDYRGTAKVKFNINGINIANACTAEVNDGIVRVYKDGTLLPENNYSVVDYKQETLVGSIEGPNGELNTYDVTYTYVITGKGQYSGSITLKETKREMRYENHQF